MAASRKPKATPTPTPTKIGPAELGEAAMAAGKLGEQLAWLRRSRQGMRFTAKGPEWPDAQAWAGCLTSSQALLVQLHALPALSRPGPPEAGRAVEILPQHSLLVSAFWRVWDEAEPVYVRGDWLPDVQKVSEGSIAALSEAAGYALKHAVACGYQPTGQSGTDRRVPLGAAEPQQPTIWFHGDRSYSTDGNSPRRVSQEQHDLLKHFLDGKVAKDTSQLEDATNNPSAVISKLIRSFGEQFIQRPQYKGNGYYIRVRSLPAR